VQSLLAGHHPLGSADRTLMTSSLSELLAHALRAEDDSSEEEQGES